MHQGCAYNQTNIRFHLYLVPEEFTEQVGEFVGWVGKRRRKQVKPHVPQYAPGVVEFWEQKKEDLSPIKQLRHSPRNINRQLLSTAQSCRCICSCHVQETKTGKFVINCYYMLFVFALSLLTVEPEFSFTFSDSDSIDSFQFFTTCSCGQ